MSASLVGSEMCIRDRHDTAQQGKTRPDQTRPNQTRRVVLGRVVSCPVRSGLAWSGLVLRMLL
eukprot:9375809-Alexandrium_andersonii.AAC.1